MAISVATLFSACASFEMERSPSSTGDDYSKYYDEENVDENAPKDRCGKECLRSQGDTDTEGRKINQAIQAKDVVLGMTRSQVLKSWGDPSVRELAGQGVAGHERWRYGNKFSLQGERVLIFENGRVAGWYR